MSDTASGASPSPTTQDFTSRRWAGLAVLSLSLMLVVMGNVTLTVALADIARDLKASSSDLQWTLDAYPLAMAALLFALGAVGDKFGRRAALMTGLGGFALFSVLAALGSSAGELIGYRVGLGVAAALVMPATLGLVRVTFPDHERSKALMVWSAAAGLGLAAGPLLSGLLVKPWGWEAAFWLNVPLALLLLAFTPRLLPASRNAHAGPLDPLGALLSCVALGALVYGIIEGPSAGWTSGQVLGAWAAALLALVGFIAVEVRVANPMVDLTWFRNRHFATGTVFSLLVFTVFVGMIYLITLYLQQHLQEDARSTGLRLLPVGVALLVGAPLGERVYGRFGPKLPITTGLVLIVAGTAVLSGLDASSGYAPVLWAGILMGLGGGLAIPAMTDSVMGNAPAERGSVAGAAYDAAIELGAALGIAVMGSVLATVYRDNLPAGGLAQLPPAAQEAVKDSLGAAGGVAERLPERAAGELMKAADGAFIEGFTAAGLTTTVIAAVAAVLALVIVPGRVRRRREAAVEAEHAGRT